VISARPIAGNTNLDFNVETKADGYVDNSPLRSQLPTYPQPLRRPRPLAQTKSAKPPTPVALSY